MKELEGVSQVELNKKIELFIATRDFNGDSFSKEDIDYIQQYEGGGGQGKHGATGEGILYEFYTPQYIVDLMWELAYNHGYDGGPILEPSVATGRLLLPAKDYTKCVGFEINPISARIAEVSLPGAKIHRGYFETAFMSHPRFTTRIKNGLTWLPEYPFSLIIGNPPYGKYKNLYSSYFPTPSIPQIEIFFMHYAMRLLKTGGILVYLVSSNFMRNGETYNQSKKNLEEFTELVDCYRLPSVFKFSEVPVDILVFRKK